jgi:hypothetical protein
MAQSEQALNDMRVNAERTSHAETERKRYEAKIQELQEEVSSCLSATLLPLFPSPALRMKGLNPVSSFLFFFFRFFVSLFCSFVLFFETQNRFRI